MGRKRNETSKAIMKKTHSKEIREFAQDACDYIWYQKKFFVPGIMEKFTDRYTLRYSPDGATETTHFTENIGKAVSVTQFLLRDYFGHFFKFTTTGRKNTFRREVKLLWLDWLDKRKNIFVKVIETMAIIAEAFLFSNHNTNLNLQFNEMSEWFVEWFEEHLASQFFKFGGWETLNPLPSAWYIGMFYSLEELGDISYSPFHSYFTTRAYNCKLVNLMRFSGIQYPVPESMICKNCRIPDDDTAYRKTIFVKLAGEQQEGFPLTETGIVLYHFEDEKFSLKTPASEEDFNKSCPPILQESQLDENQKHSNTDIVKDTPDVRCSFQSSGFPDKITSTKANFVQQNLKTSEEKTCESDLIEANLRLSTTPKLAQAKKGVSAKKMYLKEKKIRPMQIVGTIADHKEDISTDDLKTQLPKNGHEAKHNIQGRNSNTVYDDESTFSSSICFELSAENGSPKKKATLHDNQCLEQTPKAEFSFLDLIDKMTSEFYRSLEKIIPFENSSSTIERPIRKIPSPEFSDDLKQMFPSEESSQPKQLPIAKMSLPEFSSDLQHISSVTESSSLPQQLSITKMSSPEFSGDLERLFSIAESPSLSKQFPIAKMSSPEFSCDLKHISSIAQSSSLPQQLSIAKMSLPEFSSDLHISSITESSSLPQKLSIAKMTLPEFSSDLQHISSVAESSSLPQQLSIPKMSSPEFSGNLERMSSIAESPSLSKPLPIAKMPSPEFSSYLERMSSIATKPILTTIPPRQEISNKQTSKDLLTVYFYKSDSFENCMKKMRYVVINNDCHIDKLSDRNRLNFISEKHCKFFQIKLTTYLKSLQHNRNSDNPQVPIPQQSEKSENKSTSSKKIFGLNIIPCEYQFYFIGAEERGHK